MNDQIVIVWVELGILGGGEPLWYASCMVQDRKNLSHVVTTAQVLKYQTWTLCMLAVWRKGLGASAKIQLTQGMVCLTHFYQEKGTKQSRFTQTEWSTFSFPELYYPLCHHIQIPQIMHLNISSFIFIYSISIFYLTFVIFVLLWIHLHYVTVLLLTFYRHVMHVYWCICMCMYMHVFKSTALWNAWRVISGPSHI